jgi:DNA-binding transcriptional ArsR family regulator
MPYSERYTYMASVMKALAHPTRLFIVDELEKEPRNVSELTEMVGIDISTISRHLSILKQVGIIAATKNNNQMIYRLLCPCVLDMYKCVIKIKEQEDIIK